MERRKETTVVKKALIEAGFDRRRTHVGHGRGTAANWLEIEVSVSNEEYWQKDYAKAINIAQRVTGRHGDYDGQISVTTNPAWGV